MYSVLSLQAFDAYLYAAGIGLLVYIHLVLLKKKNADCSAGKCSTNDGLHRDKPTC